MALYDEFNTYNMVGQKLLPCLGNLTISWVASEILKRFFIINPKVSTQWLELNQININN